MKYFKYLFCSIIIATVFAVSSCTNSTINTTTTTTDTDTDSSSESSETCIIKFYDSDETTLLYTKTVDEGSELTDVPDVPSKEGYTSSWSVTDFSDITEDMSVYAVYTINSYDLNYYVDDELYETDTYEYDSTIDTIDSPSKDGYVFSGFYDVPDTMPAEDTSVYGYYAEASSDEYVIFFYADDVLYDYVVVEDGSILTDIPDVPEKDGYTGVWSVTDFSTISDTTIVSAVYTTEGSTSYDISDYSSETITIEDSGTYTITGTSEDVSFSITADDSVIIYLDNVEDTDLTSEFIYTESAELTIILIGDNSITESSSADLDSLIYTEQDIIFSASSDSYSLYIDSNNTAILSKKADITFESGVYEIESEDTGIQAKKSGDIIIEDSTITINSSDSSLKGKENIEITDSTIKITSDEDGINCDSFTSNNSNIYVTSENDGIQGDTLVSISEGYINVTSNGGTTGSVSLDSSTTSFNFEEEDTTDYSEEDYYGLYVLVNSAYVEIDSDNYSTYSAYSVFYDKVSCKGLKSDTEIDIDSATVVISSLDDAINCDSLVSVTDATLTIDSLSDGIQADEELDIISGTIIITTTGTFTSSSDGKYTKSGTTYTHASDSNGSYDLVGSCKGLKSDSLIEVSGSTLTIDSADDAIHSDTDVIITGGTIKLTTLDDGIHGDSTLTIGEEDADDSDISLTVSSSYEGLEAGNIYLYSGTINVSSSDDGLNAAGGSSSTDSSDSFSSGGSPFGGRKGHNSTTVSTTADYNIYIYGSTLTVDADGDGIDSNGNLFMYGGTVIVYGPTSSSNAGIDYGDDNNYFTFEGGDLLVFSSSNMMVYPTDNYVYFSSVSISEGSTYSITDGSDTLISATSTKTYSNAIVMYASASISGTYYLYNGSTKLKSASAN